MHRPSGDWLLYGGIFVRDLSLSPKMLRLEGPRVAPAPTQGNAKPSSIPLGRNIKVEISLDSPLNSLDEAQALLDRVFFLNGDSREHAKPELRRVDDSTATGPIYQVGQDGIKPPRATYTPEPEFSEEARRAKFQGTVIMHIVIDKTGQITRIRLERPLGKGLDENAMERIKIWRFNPGIRNGQPVAVEMNIEVSFNLV
ncbi:MAG TPA: energy transducer TonB [Candidatus Angelobacter sp.]|nr:energy transducer TonB [Candidatus Angelobacter sp.]